MAGSTPIYGFPYPEATDLVADYPALGQQLAEDVEDALTAKLDSSGIASATVGTNQTTTSTSYTDLATVGPSVTLTTGTKALVIISTYIQTAASNRDSYASWDVSGASTVAASDTWAILVWGSNSGVQISASRAHLITGLTAGSNTFTMKYRVSVGTGSFSQRTITVLDLGSS